MRERLPTALGLALMAASFLLVLAWPWLRTAMVPSPTPAQAEATATATRTPSVRTYVFKRPAFPYCVSRTGEAVSLVNDHPDTASTGEPLLFYIQHRQDGSYPIVPQDSVFSQQFFNGQFTSAVYVLEQWSDGEFTSPIFVFFESVTSPIGSGEMEVVSILTCPGAICVLSTGLRGGLPTSTKKADDAGKLQWAWETTPDVPGGGGGFALIADCESNGARITHHAWVDGR